ncbi:serine/arginine repetitive matrix protein 2 [Streptomyces sp. NPDC006482]|uniref:serine/arginine repetitive matrix protein 2 n=1 Tax=Streptomyces sp. NPDC006482 TaxID=3154306 RepID=UPI0033A4056D
MSTRWNDETQSWETGGGATGQAPVPTPPPVPVAPPPPPPPSYTPEYVPETGEWQYPVSSAPAPAPAGRPRARGAVVAGVAVAVLAAGSVGTWLIWDGGEGDRAGVAGAPPASVTASQETTSSDDTTDSPTDYPSDTETSYGTDSPSPSDSATTPPMDDVPPPGYHAVEDIKGFTLAVPEGWDRTESDQGVFYNAPDGRSLLQVFVIVEPGMTPYEALRGASEDGRTNKPGYEEISLDRVTGEPGAPPDAAELVYAYSREGGRRKVVDRAFTAADGNHYAILSAGPEADWPEQREVLRVALDFFHPGAH